MAWHKQGVFETNCAHYRRDQMDRYCLQAKAQLIQAGVRKETAAWTRKAIRKSKNSLKFQAQNYRNPR